MNPIRTFLHLSILAVSLAALSARAGVFDTNCPPRLYSITIQHHVGNGEYAINQIVHGHAGWVEPFEGCRVLESAERWIVRLENADFEGSISSYAGIEIQLVGENHMTCTGGWDTRAGILALGGLVIAGPGSLSLYTDLYGQSAISVEGGWFWVWNGAVVDVRVKADVLTIGIDSYGDMAVLDSALTVACEGSAYGNGECGISARRLLVDNSIVAAASPGSGISVSGTDISDSVVAGIGRNCGYRSGGIESESIRNSVFLAYGWDFGARFHTGENNPDSGTFLSRVVGAVVGGKTGLYARNLDLADVDLTVVGNAWWQADIGSLESPNGAGIYLPYESGEGGIYRQRGGRVSVSAALNVGVRAPQTFIESGTLDIGAVARSADMLRVFTGGTEEKVLASIGNGFSRMDRLSDLDGWLNWNVRTRFYLNDEAQGRPRVGHAGADLSVSGGALAVVATEVGLLRGYRSSAGYAKKGGTMTVSGGAAFIFSEGSAVADFVGWNGKKTFSFVGGLPNGIRSGIDISGGFSWFQGGTNAVVLSGDLRQTGGTLCTVVTGSVATAEISAWPCVRGANIRAGGWHEITGGSFLPSGGWYNGPKTDAAHGRLDVYPCRLSIDGNGPAEIASVTPSWYGVHDLYPIGGFAWLWLPAGGVSVSSGGTVWNATVGKRIDNVFVSGGTDVLAGASPSSVFRFYSKTYKGHFFTISEKEKNNLIASNPNWKHEGVAYKAFKEQLSGTVALHRFYSKNYKGHFFTIDEAEAETIRRTNTKNWKYEGVAYYVYPSAVDGSVPVHRFWSKRYRHHFYTINETEKENLIATNPNWKYEQIAFWAIPATGTGTEAESVASNDLAEDMTVTAPWKLSALPGGEDVAVDIESVIGGMTVTTRANKPDAAELAAEDYAGTEDMLTLRLKLPDGSWNATPLSAVDGTLDETSVQKACDFAIPANGIWHWLGVRGVGDDADAFSLWLKAE